MLLSGSDGWIQDYTVETSLDGVSWNLSATVKRSTVVLRYIKFDNGPLNAKQLRVIITAAQRGYSRICELSPVYAVSTNSTTNNPLETSSTTTKSSPSLSTTTTELMTTLAPPSPVNSSKTKPNTAEIIAGVLAGLAGILLGLQAYILWLLRKKQSNGGNISTYSTGVGVGIEGTAGGQTVIISDDPHQKNPIIGFSFHTITATSELGDQQHPDALVGRYPRAELG